MESVKPIQKRIFQEDGFDIDLSYIIDNLIAMGYLSESIVSMYLTMPCQILVKSPLLSRCAGLARLGTG